MSPRYSRLQPRRGPELQTCVITASSVYPLGCTTSEPAPLRPAPPAVPPAFVSGSYILRPGPAQVSQPVSVTPLFQIHQQIPRTLSPNPPGLLLRPGLRHCGSYLVPCCHLPSLSHLAACVSLSRYHLSEHVTPLLRTSQLLQNKSQTPYNGPKGPPGPNPISRPSSPHSILASP